MKYSFWGLLDIFETYPGPCRKRKSADEEVAQKKKTVTDQPAGTMFKVYIDNDDRLDMPGLP